MSLFEHVNLTYDYRNSILFVADAKAFSNSRTHSRVLKVVFSAMGTAQVTLYAGSDSGETYQLGDSAHLTNLNSISSLWCDQSSGKLYVAAFCGPSAGYSVYRIDYVYGRSYWIAGAPSSTEVSSTGDGSAATSATFKNVVRITGDTIGNICITNFNESTIRRLCLSTGTVYTLAQGTPSEIKPLLPVFRPSEGAFHISNECVVNELSYDYLNPARAEQPLPLPGLE